MRFLRRRPLRTSGSTSFRSTLTGIRPEKGRNRLLIFIFAFKGWGFSPAFFLPRFFACGTGTTIQLLALRLDSYRIISIRTSCKRNSPPADRKEEFNGLGSQERANGKFASNVGGNRSHRAGVSGIGRRQSHERPSCSAQDSLERGRRTILFQ